VFINLETIYALEKESVLKNVIKDELEKLETLITDILPDSEDISSN
jgi:hypothetical protein